jgi:hypothetical protein
MSAYNIDIAGLSADNIYVSIKFIYCRAFSRKYICKYIK